MIAAGAVLLLSLPALGQNLQPSFPLRINSGASSYFEPNSGVLWDADNFYAGGSLNSQMVPIWDTTNPTVYKSYRSGTFSYILTGVPNGGYTVTLKFAELEYPSAGQRVFDVSINGQPFLTNFDIFKNAGGANIALDRATSITVAGNAIAIAFLPKIGSAQVNGIEITYAGGSSQPPPAPAPAPQPSAANRKPTGALDPVSSAGAVSGWAHDPDNLNLPVQVQIFIDANAGTPTAPGGSTTSSTSGSPLLTPNGEPCRVDLLTENLPVLMLPVELACATINRNFVGEIDYRGADGRCYHTDWRGSNTIPCESGLAVLPGGQIPSPFDPSFNWLAARARCYYTTGDIGAGAPPYGMSSDKICGWGGNDHRAASHVVTILKIAGGGAPTAIPIATLTASAFRAGAGNHGFSFQIPSQYADGKPHLVWAWAVDLTDTSGASNTQLPGSPVTAILGNPSPAPSPGPSPAPAPAPAPATGQMLSFASPANGQTISGMAAVAAVVANSIDGGSVTLAVDNAIPKTLYYSALGYSTLLNTARMSDGPHTLTLAAKDGAGRNYTAAITVTVANSGAPQPAPAPAPATGANKVPGGLLEGVKSDGTVQGWAADTDSPNAAVAVRLYVDYNRGASGALPLATVYAAENRPDVGNHGFSFRLPNAYFDGKPHQVWAWAVDPADATGAHDAQLPGSPASFSSTSPANSIVHQVALPVGQRWCEDTLIGDLLAQVNIYRTQRGLAPLNLDTLAMKLAELRAVQYIQYIGTHTEGTPGFDPHEGYAATVAALGFRGAGENLAHSALSPNYVANVLWQDAAHASVILAPAASLAGVSCVFNSGVPYWTFEAGYR